MDKIIYNTALVVHIVGISMMAGATFMDVISFRQFWKILPADRPTGVIMADFLHKLQRYFGIGMLVLLVSGVGMMVFLHQVWGQQIWFRVKMGVLILIILNGLAVRRRFGNKLKKLLANETGMETDLNLVKLKTNITVGHVFQILFFAVIFVLSVFKFN